MCFNEETQTISSPAADSASPVLTVIDTTYNLSAKLDAALMIAAVSMRQLQICWLWILWSIALIYATRTHSLRDNIWCTFDVEIQTIKRSTNPDGLNRAKTRQLATNCCSRLRCGGVRIRIQISHMHFLKN